MAVADMQKLNMKGKVPAVMQQWPLLGACSMYPRE